MRDKIRKLERGLQGTTDCIEQRDGSKFYYDPETTYSSLFLHFMSVLRSDHARVPRPEAPALIQAVAKAKDRRRAFEQALDGFSFVAYQKDPLIERGELVPSQLTTEGPMEA